MTTIPTWVLCLIAVTFTMFPARAESETITAVAAMGGGADSTVTFVVNRLATDAERDELVAAVKKGGSVAARAVLEKRADAGTLQVGAQHVAIKHAYSRTTTAGRLLTIVTADPIKVGNGAAGAAGQAVGLAILEVGPSGPGHGELVPEAHVRVDDQGAIVTGDAAAKTIALSKVTAK
jgi:hypothetical protein